MNQEKISNQKLLYCILVLFFTVFTGIVIITYSYFNKVKELFEQSLNQKMCIENLDIQKISYESFISQHYQIQSNWITFWLAFTGIVLTLVTIIMPIIAMKNNEKQEEKFTKLEDKAEGLCNRARDSIEKCENAKKDVSKDLEEVKKAEKEIKIDLHLASAYNLYWSGRYMDAILEYKNVLSIDENNRLALSNLSENYIQLGLYKEAIDSSLKCLDKYNNDICAYQNLIHAYIFNNQFKDAIETLKKFKNIKGAFIFNVERKILFHFINISKIIINEEKNEIVELINNLDIEMGNSRNKNDSDNK